MTIEMTAEGLTLRKKGRPAVIDAAEPREIPEWSEEASTPKPGRRRFCGQCGSRLDEQTGLCPVCQRRRKYGGGSEENIWRGKYGSGLDRKAQTEGLPGLRPDFFPLTRQTAPSAEADWRIGNRDRRMTNMAYL